MQNRSFSYKTFLSTASLVLICFFVAAAGFVIVGRTAFLRDGKDSMVTCANEVARVVAVVNVEEDNNYWSLNMMLTAMAETTDRHIFITDAEGVITSCSEPMPTCRHIGQRVGEDILATVNQKGVFRKVCCLKNIYSGKRMVAAVPVTQGTAADGYVFVTCTVQTLLSGWSAFMGLSAIVLVAVIALSLGMLFAYSRYMARPLDEMAEVSRKFARGDFSARVKQEYDTQEEIGALVDAFNTMADSLEKSEARRNEFVSNVSHELRTPMTTIAGFADGILDGTIPPEEQTKYLTSIRDETRRLARLVRDMLDTSRMKASLGDISRRTTFDMTELLIQTLLGFENRAEKKHLDVDLEIPDDHIMTHADKDAITRVVYNLIDNAVKFAHNDTVLTLSLYLEGEKVICSVKDEGETIPPDDLPLVFDRFHKSDRSRSLDKDGVGLGLYLVKEIINSHDEDIVCRSENNITEFAFTLPLVK